MIFQKQIAKIIAYSVPKLSDDNLIGTARILSNLAPKKSIIARNIRREIEKKGPAFVLLKRIIAIHPNYRKKISNWALETLTKKIGKWEHHTEKGDYEVPRSIFISPTMRCNLECKGCCANDYSAEEDLDFETVDRIIKEGRKMGVLFYSFLGGEPFVWKNLFRICAENKDCMFQVYTNGTLISERTVKTMQKLGNLIPILGLEGFEKETDKIRGKNVYKRIHYSMSLLKQNKIPFGYSICITKSNADIVMSERFVDMMMRKGALIGQYFFHMPFGKNPRIDDMPTPLQRLKLLKLGRIIRQKKPIFMIDFWNDAPYFKGCIAARHCIHITNTGDVEPCLFSHIAADNIKNKRLIDVLKSDFFSEIRKLQPFNENLFLPCMWTDNPRISRELFKKFNIHLTHPNADFILKNKKAMRKIDRYSKEVEELYRPEWENFKRRAGK